MVHVEFIGAAGSGKSTIHTELMSEDFLYAGAAHYYDVSRKFRFPIDKFVKLAPSRIRKKIWRSCILNDLVEFFIKYPDALRPIKECEENKKIMNLFLKWCSIYIHNEKTKKKHEWNFMDEGFCQTGTSICFRSNIECPSKSYLEAIPQPDILILVISSPHLCQERQMARKREQVYDTSTIELQHRASENIANWMEKRGTRVIKVKNNEGIKHSVNNIRRELREYKI